jgi:hypothetical protein
MHYFFPSFFNKLSSVELDYLKCNERWVLDIFGDFWDLVMKKFDNSVVSLDLRPFGLDQDSPGDTHPNPPPDGAPLDATTHCLMDPEEDHTKDSSLILDGNPRTHSYPVSGAVDFHTKEKDANNLTLVGHTINPPNHFPRSIESLSPKPLPVTNHSTLLPSASLRSNVTIQKNSRARLIKAPPRAIEGGLASFSELSPNILDLDCSQPSILPVSMEFNHVLTSTSALRASQSSTLGFHMIILSLNIQGLGDPLNLLPSNNYCHRLTLT